MKINETLQNFIMRVEWLKHQSNFKSVTKFDALFSMKEQLQKRKINQRNKKVVTNNNCQN